MLIAQCRIKFGRCLEVYGVDVPTVEVLENSFLVLVLVRGHLGKPLLVAWQNATRRGMRVIEKVPLSRIGIVGSEPGAKGQECFEVGRVFLRTPSGIAMWLSRERPLQEGLAQDETPSVKCGLLLSDTSASQTSDLLKEQSFVYLVFCAFK